MMNFLLAIVAFLVVRLIGRSGLIKFAMTGQTTTEMREKTSFHAYFISYILGTLGFYGTLTVILALLVKQYIL